VFIYTQLDHQSKGLQMKKVIGILSIAMTSVGLLMAGSAVQAQDIVGAGATFPAPLYAKWAADYNKETGIKVNYQSVGSGAGIKQIESKTVDFGASDMPLKDEDLAAKGLVQFPTVIGGVVPVISLKGIAPGQLKLTGQVLGDIYLGKITMWDDKAIKALNPSLPLPTNPISVVRRADGSGTTFIFTNYLSKVNKEWKEKVGEGTAVNWPVGAGGKGNEGVAAYVSRLPNSIGYVEYAYVKQNKMNFALVQNAAGNYPTPDDLTFKAAAAGVDWSKSFYQILTNASGKDAWPLSGATFLLLQAKPVNMAKTQSTLNFVKWAFAKGDKTAEELDYVPMPAAVKTMIEKSWSVIK
jgi:phosphate transport system substrate-binding protein